AGARYWCAWGKDSTAGPRAGRGGSGQSSAVSGQRRGAEVFGGEGGLSDLCVDPFEAVGPGIRTGADDPLQAVLDEVKGHAVLRGVAAGDVAACQELVVGRPAFRLAVVVGAVAPAQKAEASKDAECARDRVSDPLFEPADGAGAQAAQQDALLPGFA